MGLQWRNFHKKTCLNLCFLSIQRLVRIVVNDLRYKCQTCFVCRMQCVSKLPRIQCFRGFKYADRNKFVRRLLRYGTLTFSCHVLFLLNECRVSHRNIAASNDPRICSAPATKQREHNRTSLRTSYIRFSHSTPATH